MQLLGLELLSHGFFQLLTKKWVNLEATVHKRLSTWILKAVVLWLLMSLASCALFLTFIALALYINTALGSSYQGFLWASGICTGLFLPLLLLFWQRWKHSNDRLHGRERGSMHTTDR